MQFGEDVEADVSAELLERTPGMATFNPFTWPCLHRRPLAFIAHADSDLMLRDAEAVAAMESAFGELGWTFDGPSPYGLLFKEVDGPRYVAVVDLD